MTETEPHPNRVAIVIEGGLVQAVCADRPAEVRILVVDYDSEGADPAALVEVPQADGRTAEAVVAAWTPEPPAVPLKTLFDLAEPGSEDSPTEGLTARQRLLTLARQSLQRAMDDTAERLETLAEPLESGRLRELQGHARLFGFETAEAMRITLMLQLLHDRIRKTVYATLELLREERERRGDPVAPAGREMLPSQCEHGGEAAPAD